MRDRMDVDAVRCAPAGSSTLHGGAVGVIPIKYRNYQSAQLNMLHYSLAHPDFTRTGSYYLPPVSCSLQAVVGKTRPNAM